MNKIENLPELIGTTTDVKLAGKIRNYALTSDSNVVCGLALDSHPYSSVDFARLIPSLTPEDREEADRLIQEAAGQALNRLLTETDAPWWIARDEDAHEYVRDQRNRTYQHLFHKEIEAFWVALEAADIAQLVKRL